MSLRLPRRNTEVNADFSTPRQTGGGLRLDFSPQQSSFARINQAIGQGPRYREVDVSSGGQAVAGVMDYAGAQMSKLLARNQEITDQRKLFENETTLRVAQEQIALEIAQEKDPTKHREIFERRFGEAVQGLNYEGMSPYAAEVMRQQSDRLYKLGTVRTQMDSFKANEAMLLDEVEADRMAGKATGDVTRVGRANARRAEITGESPDTTMNRTVVDAVETSNVALRNTEKQVSDFVDSDRYNEGLAFVESDPFLNLPGNAAHRDIAIKALVTGKQMADFKATMYLNPNAMRDKLEKGEDPSMANLTPEMRSDMMRITDIEIATRSNRQINRVNDHLAKPGMRSAVLEALKGTGYSDLTPAARAELIQEVGKEVPSNDPDAYMATLKALANFEGGEDAEVNEAQITTLEAMAKTKFSGEFMESIGRAATTARARINGTATEDDNDPIDKQIINAMTDGYFIPYELPYSQIKDKKDLSPADRVKQGIKPDTLVVNQRLKSEAVQKANRVRGYNQSLIKSKVPLHERERLVTEMMDNMGLALEFGSPHKVINTVPSDENFLLPGIDGKANATQPSGSTQPDSARSRLDKGLKALEKARTSNTPNPALPE